MKDSAKKYGVFQKKLLIIGFGSIGQAVIPLILRHLEIETQQITIISKKTEEAKIANALGITFIPATIKQDNYQEIIGNKLSAGDFLLNLSVDICSVDLIKLCQQKNALYLDTCIEPWAGWYKDGNLSASSRSNYALRENALALRKGHEHASTAVITHGANPGLVSHFIKQALMNLAKDNGLTISPPQSQLEWAALAKQLNIKVVHIAERDTQVALQLKQDSEFVNTWSIDGFVAEGTQPAELGWGSHEKHWPQDAYKHDFGCQAAIYLNRPGAATRVRTWTPVGGAFHGFLVTHGESISIANYFTLNGGNDDYYRPTVHYAYLPCEDAVLSLHELASREWHQQENQRLLSNEIVSGMDELGVLLMGNQKGAYWYGSQLTIDQARKLAPYNTATSLQVAVGVLAALLWAIENPNEGVVEPDFINYQFVMNIAKPYLGTLKGYYTDWTPLQNRGRLFREVLDYSDPWQFVNIRVQ